VLVPATTRRCTTAVGAGVGIDEDAIAGENDSAGGSAGADAVPPKNSGHSKNKTTAMTTMDVPIAI
jgi:hypothetical protein